MAESINLKGMVIRAFDEKSRSKNEKTDRWFLAILKNDDGDSITVRTDKKILLKLIAGEKVDVTIVQAQQKLGDMLEYKKGEWIPEEKPAESKNE
jgi:hypothetical protein